MGAGKMVVLLRRKFLLLLAVSMNIPAGVAIALNAFVAVKRGGEDVLPLVLSDSASRLRIRHCYDRVLDRIGVFDRANCLCR